MGRFVLSSFSSGTSFAVLTKRTVHTYQSLRSLPQASPAPLVRPTALTMTTLQPNFGYVAATAAASFFV